SRQGQESPVPGESAKETVKTIAQGMPDDPAEPVVPSPCFFTARGPWVRPSPGIPCALSLSRARSEINLGAICAAGTLNPVSMICRHCEARRAGLSAEARRAKAEAIQAFAAARLRIA